ncbi:pyridoxamine 5'-phosphate oxidase family protein [Algicella marina]|uniref:Pyridoxamine 5'-phosphate oxidase family protein n=1 Tax=Algicella marina TaxID=2683284 RepID=A0A6P1T1Z3_9RHOB|nr:pyridoxamine 5'-phosphate oxidase family protein [Algicella marina]QHQ36758.1 pyridoxamine 5'-phosphate oxidase family protein [Algicella marina]
MARIETEAALRAIYQPAPGPASTDKVADHITPEYRAWIEASPFCTLATIGPAGLDASPRGDIGQVTFVQDDGTLALPDRRGNNRIDSLLNIVRDPRVSLMYLIPGSGTVIRVNGTAEIRDDADLLKHYAQQGREPRSVIIVSPKEVYFQCARAVLRAGLWKPPQDTGHLPSVGTILEGMTRGGIDGETYDSEWPARAARTMW